MASRQSAQWHPDTYRARVPCAQFLLTKPLRLRKEELRMGSTTHPQKLARRKGYHASLSFPVDFYLESPAEQSSNLSQQDFPARSPFVIEGIETKAVDAPVVPLDVFSAFATLDAHHAPPFRPGLYSLQTRSMFSRFDSKNVRCFVKSCSCVSVVSKIFNRTASVYIGFRARSWILQHKSKIS